MIGLDRAVLDRAGFEIMEFRSNGAPSSSDLPFLLSTFLLLTNNLLLAASYFLPTTCYWRTTTYYFLLRLTTYYYLLLTTTYYFLLLAHQVHEACSYLLCHCSVAKRKYTVWQVQQTVLELLQSVESLWTASIACGLHP